MQAAIVSYSSCHAAQRRGFHQYIPFYASQRLVGNGKGRPPKAVHGTHRSWARSRTGAGLSR